MLQLEIPEREMFDEKTSEFVNTKKAFLQLEHSLVSLSKWESKWCKPFLGNADKSDEETLDYIRCMTISQNINPDIYLNLPSEIFYQVNKYINEKMTATWFGNEKDSKINKEVITAEIIYYWMIAQTIPMECQKWHLNRLLTLIKVCDIKNAPTKKQGRKEMLENRASLNKARKEQYKTKG